MTIFANKILRAGALTMIGMHGWLLQWPYYLLNMLLRRWIAMKQQPLPHPREPVAPMKAGWIGPLKVAYTAHGITNGGVKKLCSFNFSIFQPWCLPARGFCWENCVTAPAPCVSNNLWVQLVMFFSTKKSFISVSSTTLPGQTMPRCVHRRNLEAIAQCRLQGFWSLDAVSCIIYIYILYHSKIHTYIHIYIHTYIYICIYPLLFDSSGFKTRCKKSYPSDAAPQPSAARTDGDSKTARVKVLTPEQKQAVLELTSPDQVPIQERRRQYNAINRRFERPGAEKTYPPGLIQKWQDATDGQKKFLVATYGNTVIIWCRLLYFFATRYPFATRLGT